MRRINQKVEATGTAWKAHKEICAACTRSANTTCWPTNMCSEGNLLYRAFCLAVDDDVQAENRRVYAHNKKRRQQKANSKHSQG